MAMQTKFLWFAVGVVVVMRLVLVVSEARGDFGDDDIRLCLYDDPVMIEHCHDPGYVGGTYMHTDLIEKGEEFVTFIDLATIAPPTGSVPAAGLCSMSWSVRYASEGLAFVDAARTVDDGEASIGCEVGPSGPMWDCPLCDTEVVCTMTDDLPGMPGAPSVFDDAAEVEMLWAAGELGGDWMLKATEWDTYDWSPTGCDVFRDYGQADPSILVQVPEPSQALLFAAGLPLLVAIGRRRHGKR